MGPGIFISLTILTLEAILDIGQLDFAGQTHCNNTLGFMNQVMQRTVCREPAVVPGSIKSSLIGQDIGKFGYMLHC
jgi:hypothetical protein